MKILEPKSSGSSVLRAELPEAFLICELENRSVWIVNGKTDEKNKRIHLNRTLGGYFYNSAVAFDTDAGAAES